MGLMYTSNNGTEVKLGLPFALDSIEILDRCDENMWAIARYSDGINKDSKITKVDIDICDSQGKINVSLRGFTSREYDGSTVKEKKPKTKGTMLLESVWKEKQIKKGLKEQEYEKRLVILCETGKEIKVEGKIKYIRL